MSLMDKYLDMDNNQLDNLLMGIDLNKKNDNTDKKDKKFQQLNCSSCESDKLVTNQNGELICKECGLVNQETYNEIGEFNSDMESSSRYGAPSSYFYPKSALGTKFRTKGFSRVSCLQRQGQMPYKEKSLMEKLKGIEKKCKQYGISQTMIDRAKIYYKKISDCKHTKGKRAGKSRIMRCDNLKSIIAACVFKACLAEGCPRATKEIAYIYDLDIKDVNKGIRKFDEFITLEEDNDTSKSPDYVNRYGKKLGLEDKYIDITKNVADNITKLDIASTHEPQSVAAGCFLLVAVTYNLPISKSQISEVFKISDVTISKTFKRISPFHNIIMNNKITELLLIKKQNEPVGKNKISPENLVLSVEEKKHKKQLENNKIKKRYKKKSLPAN